MPCNEAFADLPRGVDPTENDRIHNRAEEYFSEQVPGEVLITVHLLGAVNRPGVYHVPRSTDVVHLISLAGGTRPDADLSHASIKRRSKASEEVIQCNLKEYAGTPGVYPPTLLAGDMVLVYAKDPFIAPDTLAVLSVVTTLFSIAVSATLVFKALK